MSAVVEPLRKAVTCPNCEVNSVRAYYPFCSKRCSEMDLHRWFSDGYVLPSNEPVSFEEE